MNRKKKNLRIFSSLILFLFLGLLVPNTALADAVEDTNPNYQLTAWNNTINGSIGDWTIRHNCTLDLSQIPNDSGQTYSDAGNKTIAVDGTGVAVTVKGSESKTYKNLTILIKGGAVVKIQNLNITDDSFHSSPIIAGDSNSDNALKFLGDNNIIATKDCYPGILVTTPAAISIEGDDPSSKLQVTGGREGAGIGALSWKAGLVGELSSIPGYGTLFGFDGGTITIGGSGTVEATGGAEAAGIGGGYKGRGGTITIGGSVTVKATGGAEAAGIGGGYDAYGGIKTGSTVIIGGSGTVIGDVDGSTPVKLIGVPPTAIGAANGKITGTTTAMEYKLASPEVSTYTNCLEGETGGLQPGSYSVRVKAAGGNTTSSAVTVNVPESNVPEAPVNLTATSGVLKVGLSWDAVPAATTYKVYKSTTSGSLYQLVSENISTHSIEVRGLTGGTTYYFVVKASKDGVDSANSTEASAVPQADTEKPVIHLTGSSSVNLTYGATYTDQGATASDNVDGDITAGIIKTINNSSGTTTSAINTSQPGTYTIHYNVSDATGNAADEVTRTVIVQAYIPPYVPPYIPPTPQPIIENRQASIKVGKGEGSVQTVIERITYPDGTKKDIIVFDENTTEKIIKETFQENSTFAEIDLTDKLINSADIMDIKFPKAASEELPSNSRGLSLKTEKEDFYLTPETLAKLKGKDVEITISKEKDNSEIGNTKALILKLASGGQIISDTLKIEANYTGRTKITIPIDPAILPKEKEKLNKFLDSLAVMVHHSDGEDVVDKGTVVYDEKGNIIGISLWVDKFSSFTLIEMPKDYFQGKTTVMKDKVAADKEWNIKFTKAVDASTVTKDNVYVVDSKGNKVEVKINYGSEDLLKVTPVNPYTSGETYYLYISKNVRAKDRTSLVNGLRYQFTIK